MSSTLEGKGFTAEVLAVTPADGELCVAHVHSNGLCVKLFMDQDLPELIHCVAKDMQGNELKAAYALKEGDTVNNVLIKLMETLVALQSQLAVQERQEIKLGGQHVRH